MMHVLGEYFKGYYSDSLTLSKSPRMVDNSIVLLLAKKNVIILIHALYHSI